MNKNALLALIALCGCLFLTSCAVVGVLAAGLLQDAPQPAAAQRQAANADADAHVWVSSRCTGLFVTGCNVTVSQAQAQAQEQRQAQAAEPAKSEGESEFPTAALIGGLLMFLLVIFLISRG